MWGSELPADEAHRRRCKLWLSSAEAEAETESTQGFNQIPAGKRKRPSATRMKNINLFLRVSGWALHVGTLLWFMIVNGVTASKGTNTLC